MLCCCAALLFHCSAVVVLLFHCCAVLLLFCCFVVVLPCCCFVVVLLFHCCAVMMHCCCFIVCCAVLTYSCNGGYLCSYLRSSFSVEKFVIVLFLLLFTVYTFSFIVAMLGVSRVTACISLDHKYIRWSLYKLHCSAVQCVCACVCKATGRYRSRC